MLPLMVRRMEELPEKMAGDELCDERRRPDAATRGEGMPVPEVPEVPPPPIMLPLLLRLLLRLERSRSMGFGRVPPWPRLLLPPPWPKLLFPPPP